MSWANGSLVGDRWLRGRARGVWQAAGETVAVAARKTRSTEANGSGCLDSWYMDLAWKI